MKVTITHNGFHGYTSCTIEVAGTAGDEVELTPSQIKKLHRAACGSSSCRCGESIVKVLAQIESGLPYDPIHNPSVAITIPENGKINLRGSYPQG